MEINGILGYPEDVSHLHYGILDVEDSLIVEDADDFLVLVRRMHGIIMHHLGSCLRDFR